MSFLPFVFDCLQDNMGYLKKIFDNMEIDVKSADEADDKVCIEEEEEEEEEEAEAEEEDE